MVSYIGQVWWVFPSTIIVTVSYDGKFLSEENVTVMTEGKTHQTWPIYDKFLARVQGSDAPASSVSWYKKYISEDNFYIM